MLTRIDKDHPLLHLAHFIEKLPAPHPPVCCCNLLLLIIKNPGTSTELRALLALTKASPPVDLAALFNHSPLLIQRRLLPLFEKV